MVWRNFGDVNVLICTGKWGSRRRMALSSFSNMDSVSKLQLMFCPLDLNPTEQLWILLDCMMHTLVLSSASTNLYAMIVHPGHTLCTHAC